MQFFTKKRKRFISGNSKGFTILELIIVCSIIVILSSIVLVSLNSARDKAKDARIVENMRQLLNLAQREINRRGGVYDFNDFIALIYDIEENGGKCGDDEVVCIFTDQVSTGPVRNFCAKTQLNTGDWWCIDSNLTSKRFVGDPFRCGEDSGSGFYNLTCE